MTNQFSKGFGASFMHMSDLFLPVLKENPSEAQIVSHRLMLRSGMIRQAAAGVYSWLPMGLKVLKKIEQIVREEQDNTGAQEILMPTIQPADLWRESGRYEDYGREMLRMIDRHDRDMLYGPTNEELITDIFRSTVKSYRDLPKNLYHIQWKFRDEVRPRFGIMRGREFLMKDNYSFDIDFASARHSYNKMFVAYLRTFERLGLKAIPMEADTGPIGGDMSHEFIILADTGESEVYCHSDYLDFSISDSKIDYETNLTPIIKDWTNRYAATDEKHDIGRFETSVPVKNRIETRGIEVGHIFYFGTKYSSPMGARVAAPKGGEIDVEMGSYGIGISRLVAAIIEASHDDDGIIWPESVSPFNVGLINLKVGNSLCDKTITEIYSRLTSAGLDVLIDDTDERAGSKFATMDLIGLPFQVIVGPRGLANGNIEIKNRRSGHRAEMPLESVLEQLLNGKNT